MSPRRAVNEVYLYLLAKRDHHEGCTDERCAPRCDVVRFHQLLEAPLLLSELRRADEIQERLQALARGEIPA